MELNYVLYTGDEIIGHANDVCVFLNKLIQSEVDRFLKDDIEEDYFIDEIKELHNLILSIKQNDYDLIRITEHSMGGYVIKELEEI